jgi:hydroxymethylglutaryl-CoA lyase
MPTSPEITILDVTPRDGLQDAARFVPTEMKLQLIAGLRDAGYRRVEVTSFAHPRWIPLLADAEAVYRYAQQLLGVDWIALVPNWRGWERARQCGAKWVTVVVSASEAHNQANLRRSRAQTLEEIRRITAAASESGTGVRGAIATAFHCPFAGEVALQTVVDVAEQLVAAGVAELSVADTLGQARPEQVYEVVGALKRLKVPLSLHLHDRHGEAARNLAAGIEAGIDQVECGIGGLGGCPFAPGAGANLAIDEVAQVFARYGVPFPIDLERVHALRAMLDQWIGESPVLSRE